MANASTAQEASAYFLQSNSQLLGLSAGLNELRVSRSFDSLTGKHVVYQQVYNGLPVFGGDLGVHLGKDLAVNLVNADLKPISVRKSLPVFPNSAGALRSAIAKVGPKNEEVLLPSAQKGVIIQSGAPVAVWKINFKTKSPAGAWEVFVDATNSKVLSYRNNAEYLDGAGLVFDPNPVATSGIAGLTYNDSRVDPQRINVTLQGLDGSGFLQGTYASTAISGSISRINQTNNVFSFSHTTSAFHEVMAYYHVDTIQRYLQSLGFNNINNRQIAIDVDGISEDNSFFDPGSGSLTFGTGGVPDAEDADVIWHETGHAIQHAQVDNWGATEEGGAMGEGWGDYWAGSHGAGIGPNSPAWDVYTFKWDAISYNPGNPAFLRRLDSPRKYPEGMDGEVHDDGEIWSATLWKVRAVVGKTRADKTILESHFALSSTSGFTDAALAIIEANKNLYAGADEAAIRNVFASQGILPATTSSFSIAGTITSNGSGFAGAVAKVVAGGITGSVSASNTSGKSIPDNDPAGLVLPLSLPVAGSLTSVKVTVDVSHDYVGDVEMTLVHPDGTTVRLVSTDQSNSRLYIHTTYPDNTAPEQSLSVLNGKGSAGTWKLIVKDNAEGGFGRLNWWTLTAGVSNGAVQQTFTTGADGKYSFSNLPAATYTVSATATGKTFQPASRSVTVGPSATGVDFSAGVVALSGLSLSSATITGGGSVTGTVTLASPAATNTVVALTDNAPAASIPSSVTVLSGASTANFTVTTATVSANQVATITATYAGVSKTANLTITPPPALSGLTLSKSAVFGGDSLTGTASISSTGSSVKTIGISDNSTATSVPNHVDIAAGATSATFNVVTFAVSSSTSSTITATSGSVTKTAVLAVNPKPALSSVTLSAATVFGGDSVTGKITLSATSSSSTSVGIADNSTATSVPKSVSVAAGSTTATFNVVSFAVSSDQISTITATLGTVQKTVSLTVKPKRLLSGFSLSSTSVTAGTNVTGTLTFSAQGSTTSVGLTDNSGATSVPKAVSVAGTATTVTFTVQTFNVASSQVSTITATSASVTKTASVTVTPGPVLKSLTVNKTSVKGGTNATGTITISLPAPGGGTSIVLTTSSSVVTVHSPAIVAQGATTAIFTIKTTVVGTDTPVTISASRAGVTKSVTITVTP